MELLCGIFSRLLSMSLTALPVLAAVLAARWLLRKAPKKYSYGLWAVVGLRLACPWTLARAGWSLFNLPPLRRAAEAVTVSGGGSGGLIPPAFSLPGQGATAAAPQESMATIFSPGPSAGELALQAAALVWAAGLAAVLLYGAVSWVRLRRRTSTAVLREAGVWECDGIGTPFVLGLFRPRIYLPFRLDEGQRTYVLAHERFHIRHLDHWVKLLAYLLLAVYWWNPTVWLGWLLVCRDMEMRCDEAVLAKLGGGAKEGYSLALVSFAEVRRYPTALAFGEHDASRRVKNVLDWRRETPRMAFLALTAVLAVVMVCCFNGTEKKSWVKVEGGSGAAFTCDLRDPIRSWAIYEDIYEDGTLISSVPRMVNGYPEDGDGAANGRFSGTIRADVTYAENGGFGGTLDCWYDESIHWTIQLPKDHYTGAGSAVGDWGENGRFRRTLTGNGEVLLYSQLLSTEPNGTITGYHRELGVTGSNDTVVQFRLVVSTRTAEAFGDGMDAAQRLFELRTDDASGAAALLGALGMTGGYTLPPAETPDTLLVAFSEEPPDQDRLDREMMDRAAVLLALTEELEQVDWSYPAAADGSKTQKTVYFDRSQPDAWAVNMGYEDIKDLGRSASGVRALLAYLGMEGGAAAGAVAGETPAGEVPYPAMGGVVGQVAYELPEGTASVGFQTVTYDHGLLVDSQWVWTGGDEFPAAGRFYVTCAYDKGDWDRHLLWAVTPWSKSGAEPLASFETELPGYARGAHYPDYARLPLEGSWEVGHNSSTVVFAVFANESETDREVWAADPAALNDAGVLQTVVEANDLVILLRMSVSGEKTIAEGLTQVSSERFTDILGCNGVRVTETSPYGWSVRTYYASTENGGRTPIAQSFGGELEDYAVNLDGDGDGELVCNVVYNADGARRAYVYQRREDGVYRGSLHAAGLPDYLEWGVNASWSEYDPEGQVFRLHYCVNRESDYALAEYTIAEAAAAMVWEPWLP